MTRYELKDKERQAALEKALPGFTEALQTAYKSQLNDLTDFVNISISIGEGGFSGCIVSIQKNAILVKEAYDPNHWNNYPAVEPPIGVPMRIEYQTAKGHIGGILALFFDGMWHRCTPDGTTCFLTLDRDVKRFRPWDDDFKPTEWVAPCKSL